MNFILLQIYPKYLKMLENKIVRLKNIYKFYISYFFIGVISYLLFIKKDFTNIKNSIFLTKYKIYGKNVKKENYLSQKDLQLWYRPFFHRSYAFCLLMKNIIFKCKCSFNGYKIKFLKKPV